MRKIGFVVTSLLLVFFVHLVCLRYVSFFEVEPDTLFLFVLAGGFLLGPLMGETLGFLSGLMTDSMGTHLFGLQTFIFVFMGFVAGQLRRRVDSERPVPQIIIAFCGTFLYGVMGALLRSFLQDAGQRTPIWGFLLEGILNAMLMPVVFWFVDRWAIIWDIVEN